MSLWPLAFGLGGTVAAAGTLCVPAARRAVFGDVRFDWQGRELDLDRIDPDGITVRTKTDVLTRVWRIAGQAYETKPEPLHLALHVGRTDFFHQVASLGVTARLFGVKRSWDTAHPARWPTPPLQEIGDAETELFRNSFDLRWFLTLQSSRLRALEEATEKVGSLLADYRPRRLERSDDNCPLTGFLNFLVSGDLRDDLRSVSADISANLPSADVDFSRRDASFSIAAPRPFLHRLISIREWPEQVSGHLLYELMAVPGEIEVSQVVVPITKELALAMLSRKARESGFNLFSNSNVGTECVAAADLITEGKTSWCSTQLQIVVRARTPDDLDALTERVTAILAKWRVIASIETKGAPVAWFNRLPDREKLLRPLKLFSENVAALWPFQFSPVGLASSQYGPGPVRSFRTGSGQAYAFQFQSEAKPKSLGNYLVFAPSGSGKSTLIMHLLSGLARHQGTRSYIFDSKEGARFMVEAMGGVYQTFDRLALNPLDLTEDSPKTRQRLALLIRSMLGDAGQEDGIEDILSHVVETAFQIDPDRRTFNAIFELTFPPHSSARKAFTRWVTDDKGRSGLYSHVFNAPRDSLAGFLTRSFMVGINMNEALEDPNLGPPVVAHIANTIETIATRGHDKGFAIFIDEAANLLRNQAFRELAMVMYREHRKLGGAVGMAFQDPGALAKSGIADAALENTSCLFFFPNPQANRAAYEVFNLNDEQKQFIWGGGQEGRKVLLVKRNPATGFDESVILDIDLKPFGDALRFYRAGPDAVRDLITIQQQWGEQWLAHV